MTSFEFVCRRHEDYGELGWQQRGQPDYDPLGGMAVAHDVLEHGRKGDGTPADEFRALGAAIYVRGEPGYWHMKGQLNAQADKNLAADFPDIARHVIYEHMHLPTPPPTRRLESSVAEEILVEAIEEMRKLSRSEFDAGEHEEVGRIAGRAAGWMRIGYRAARRRFDAIGGGDACVLFMRIEREADDFLKRADEGDRLLVSVCIRRKAVTVKFLERGEYE